MAANRSGAKLFVAFAVLGGAFLLAHPYRRESTGSVRRLPPPPERVILRETPVPGIDEALRPEAPTAEIQPTLLAPPPGAGTKDALGNDVARLAPPPVLARTYPGSAAAGQGAAQPVPGLPAPARTIRRIHEVRDGDTLESLAQRYLGDRSRWTEIYQANRDQIDRPELLPLFARLVIPPKSPVSHAGSPEEPGGPAIARSPLVPLVP